MSVENLIQMNPQAFVQYLKDHDINRFHFVFDKTSKIVKSSHPELQAIADFIQNDERDFKEHEGIFFQINQEFDTLQAAFLHCSVRGQGSGGTRYWHYETMEAFLRDGLRLSKGMTRKNALAGLWWGGGKGVIAHNPNVDKLNPESRKSIYQDYGRLMSGIRGCYITAEDVGTHVADMAHVFSKTRFTTCIPSDMGGSGNPSKATAGGVISGMEAALAFLGKGTLQDKTVAVQGIGNVGTPLINFLFEKGAKQVIACDTSPLQVEILQEKFAGKNLEVYVIDRGDNNILSLACDIVAPCAVGGILNPTTIPTIKAPIVCGAANNQLENSTRDDQLLVEQGITYIPDFLVNRMGIVNCANEQYGYVNNDPHIEKHLNQEWEYSIYQTTLRILKIAKETGQPTAKLAVELADQLSQEPHPIFGHRGQQIIDSLVADEWFKE